MNASDKTENSDMLSRFAIALISIISSRKKGESAGRRKKPEPLGRTQKGGGEAFNERLF